MTVHITFEPSDERLTYSALLAYAAHRFPNKMYTIQWDASVQSNVMDYAVLLQKNKVYQPDGMSGESSPMDMFGVYTRCFLCVYGKYLSLK